MINIVLKSSRVPPPSTTVALTPNPKSEPLKTMFHEAMRRDNIIKGMSAKCLYHAGDTVRVCPTIKNHGYGDEIHVISIVDSYAKMGKTEKWPENDCPMIVHARCIKTGQHFYCTPGYLAHIT